MAFSLPNILAFARESVVFAKAETTPLTEIKPTATDQVLMAGDGTVTQNLGLITDPQRRNTYSPLADIPGRYDPGAISFPMLIKPRAVGTAPDGGQLLKAFFGRETIVASTSVTYQPLRMIDTRQSMTIWIKDGHFVHRAIGTVLTTATFPVQAGNASEALGQVTFDGAFTELRWTGTDTLAATLTAAATTFTATNAKKFTPGSYVAFKTVAEVVNDNAGTGYQVTAVDYVTNICTITPALAGTGLAVGDLVYPWLPTGSENGTIVHGRHGTVTRGGVSLPLMTGEISYEFPVKMLNEEKNGQDFATRFANTGTRVLNMTASVLFDANATAHWYDVKTGVKADFVCNWGQGAGTRYRITGKNWIMTAPTVSGAEERLVALTGTGSASAAYDDECVLVLD